jgi:hypothetical protein
VYETDAGLASSQLLIGAFGTASPYLLGSLVDQVGLHAAFTIEPVLIGVCALLLLAGLPPARRQPLASNP